jgi:DNA ligase (NAD+)
LIERLRTAGLNMKSDTADRPRIAQIFAGQNFVLTGTLAGLTREEASELIQQRGGRVTTSVSKKTSYVLAGSDPGSKLDKASQLALPIINEEQFREML